MIIDEGNNMKIQWATRLRGFLRHVSQRVTVAEFSEKNNYYETNTFMSRLKSKCIHLRVFDFLGIFQVIKAENEDCDIYGSFNRFLTVNKPYFIYLENPTALYHYSLNRVKYKLGKQKFAACLEDKNLKYIICMSNACASTFEKINMQIPEHVKLTTVYPLVPTNKWVSESQIHQKSQNATLECLFCVQGIRFASKGGIETMRAVEQLYRSGINIHLTVITKISDVEKSILEEIRSYSFITLYDFTFEYSELEKIYANTNILIQATSDESFGLTILEAMKGGCALIGSKIYAIPEMIHDGFNGYLVEPHYWFFDKNNIPNPKVWNHRKKTIYSGEVSEVLVESIVEKLYLLNDREKLETFCCNSYKMSMSGKFSEERIIEKWNDILQDCYCYH